MFGPLCLRRRGEPINRLQHSFPVSVEALGNSREEFRGRGGAFWEGKNLENQVLHRKVMKQLAIHRLRRDLSEAHGESVTQVAEHTRGIHSSPFRLRRRCEVLQTLDKLLASGLVTK